MSVLKLTIQSFLVFLLSFSAVKADLPKEISKKIYSRTNENHTTLRKNEPSGFFSKEHLKRFVKKLTGLPDSVVNVLFYTIEFLSPIDLDLLQLNSVFYTSGYNFGCVLDADWWDLDYYGIKPNTSMPDVLSENFFDHFEYQKEMYGAYISSNGLNVESCYKWTLIFFNNEWHFSDKLHQSEFSKFLNFDFTFNLGYEITQLENSELGPILMITGKVGYGLGVASPSVYFEKL